MRPYMLSVFLLATLCTVLPLFFPSERLKDTTKGALALVLLGTLLTPLGSLDLPSLARPPAVVLPLPEEEALLEVQARQAVAQAVQQAVCQRFSLPTEEVGVAVHRVELSTMRAELTVTLRGGAARTDHAAVAAYIETEGWGRCDVLRELG